MRGLAQSGIISTDRLDQVESVSHSAAAVCSAARAAEARAQAAVILAAVPAGSDDGPASRFAVRMIKMGGRFDRPEVRAHLEHSAAIGFNATMIM